MAAKTFQPLSRCHSGSRQPNWLDDQPYDASMAIAICWAEPLGVGVVAAATGATCVGAGFGGGGGAGGIETTTFTGRGSEAALLARNASTARIWLYCRDEAVMVMTIGWMGRLLAADSALVTGVRVAVGVAELVGLAADQIDTRMAAVPTAITAAAAMAIVRRLCLRVRAR